MRWIGVTRIYNKFNRKKKPVDNPYLGNVVHFRRSFWLSDKSEFKFLLGIREWLTL